MDNKENRPELTPEQIAQLTRHAAKNTEGVDQDELDKALDVVEGTVDEVSDESLKETQVDPEVEGNAEADLVYETPKVKESERIGITEEGLQSYTETESARVVQDYIVSTEHRIGHERISLPPTYSTKIAKLLNEIPESMNVDATSDGAFWNYAIRTGIPNGTVADVYGRTVNDPEAQFTNSVEFNGSKLNPAIPAVRKVNNETLSGDRALFRIINSLQTGSLFSCPLWHTGVWVTFRPPTDIDILTLNETIKRSKIDLGRFTYGLTFGNAASFITSDLVDFAIRHIYNITASKESGITIENLKDHLLVNDIPLLLWGLACSIHPNGFNYDMACPHNPAECTHVTSEVINPAKLLWPNLHRLDKAQLGHMSSRQAYSKSRSSIDNYRESLTGMLPRRFEHELPSGETLAFELRVPTAAQYITNGHEWVGSILELVDEILDHEAGKQERNTLVHKYANANVLRQFGHWVGKIEIDGNTIEEENTIMASLDVLSSNDEVRGVFLEEVVKFIEDTTLALIAVPKFTCPGCGKEGKGSEKKDFATLIPINVINVFFDLLTQRDTIVRRR